MPNLLTNCCQECGRHFQSVRKRRWCSDRCREAASRRGKHVPKPTNGNLVHEAVAEGHFDKRVEEEFGTRVAAWYRLQAMIRNKRVAESLSNLDAPTNGAVD